MKFLRVLEPRTNVGSHETPGMIYCFWVVYLQPDSEFVILSLLSRFLGEQWNAQDYRR